MKDRILNTTFLDLYSKLRAKNISVLLGGGFGLFLKQLDLLNQSQTKTLINLDSWPLPRSTSDIDLFFPIDVVVKLDDMKAVRATLDELNFTSIETAKYWQFILPGNNVKIDLLTGPIDEQSRAFLKTDARRVRPKGELKLHTRHTPEALELPVNQEAISIDGMLSTGQLFSGIVNIPGPFTYLMMKITAFGDQVDNPNKNLGRHHALDVYRIVAMLTESQFDETKKQAVRNRQSVYAQRVVALTETYFSSPTSLGILRLKEHEFYSDNMEIDLFISTLKEIMDVSN